MLAHREKVEIRIKNPYGHYIDEKIGYDLHKKAHMAVNNFEEDFIKIPNISMWEMEGEFHDKLFSYHLETIHSPENENDHVWCIHSAYSNLDEIIDGTSRRIVGTNMVENLLSHYNISASDFYYDMGKLLAIVQYGSLQTAEGASLLLGTDLDENIHLYMSDFELSHHWEDNDIESLVYSITSSKNYLMTNEFIEGYIHTATTYGYGDTADEVINIVYERVIGEN